MDRLARRALAAFVVPWVAIRPAGPQPAPFPAGLRIVDAAVDRLRVEAERVRNTEDRPLARIARIACDRRLQREQRAAFVAGRDLHVVAETERVVLVGPVV